MRRQADEVFNQHRTGQDRGDRIGDVLAGDIRRGTVDGLENRAPFAVVCSRHDSQSADQTGAQIRDDIAVEIFQEQDIEGTRVVTRRMQAASTICSR